MGEIADDHIDRMMYPEYDRFFTGDDFDGMGYSRLPRVINRASLLGEFPIVNEDEVKEKVIEEYLRVEVKKRGGEHRKVLYQGRSGSPDDWCFFPGGKLLIVECKAPGKKPTNQQLEELSWLNSMGFMATWVDSKEAIDLTLKQFFQEDEWV